MPLFVSQGYSFARHRQSGWRRIRTLQLEFHTHGYRSQRLRGYLRQTGRYQKVRITGTPSARFHLDELTQNLPAPSVTLSIPPILAKKLENRKDSSLLAERFAIISGFCRLNTPSRGAHRLRFQREKFSLSNPRNVIPDNKPPILKGIS